MYPGYLENLKGSTPTCKSHIVAPKGVRMSIPDPAVLLGLWDMETSRAFPSKHMEAMATNRCRNQSPWAQGAPDCRSWSRKGGRVSLVVLP
eukprot:CAMPEP_0174298510 /NCGR_PEP_ID=MMETSP0809-20121228/53938_1 /TAXON_ID=73025 ORGANISM="Eutreptiella gymnastica-like, Strain CCMP1594" /NCGR_SAMPLE_ID=MMETSP0809 /ASSEMBLY_ACC=CAM_ASM_000658 /LENGTH=90 /DNA_ID=CAMNT_0015402983 /DNA_START=63 /DNA_END=335 /DNA_ORIENTATION=-